MWKPTLLILSVALMLTACASGTPPMPVTTIYLGNADTDCPPLPSAKSGDLATLAKNHKQTTDQYHDCKARYREALMRYNNQRSNHETPK